ncbi:hypothetical protein AOLI_G00010670 [Acnodon oligacanthus]
MRESVKFLGHLIDSNGVSLDPAKFEVITRMSRADFMEEDRCTPSVKRIKSFLGMVFYYQYFIPNCSVIARLLFALTAGQKRRGKVKINTKAGIFRRLQPNHWTPECDAALSSLKENLLHSVVLAHPDFSHPFVLLIDASLDGLGAVLSSLPTSEEKACPIAFTSANFKSALIAELLNPSGIFKSCTAAYHPMSNGGTERFNRTLGNMLRTLPL